jgi:glucosamine--fructose-6-phosphate aminotransferase (isomerizing)
MCGIIGINSKKNDVIKSVLSSLKHLEYRGYDSAGIAAISDQQIQTVKAQGKINTLEKDVVSSGIKANIAIGHTRWATHGAATKINAHPHQTEQVSVVHNGIIENFISIKDELIQLGHSFISQTDSEVIPHLITYYLNKNLDPLEAVKQTVQRLEGAFSIAVIFLNYPDLMIAARKGSPLVLGYGEEETSVASDAHTLAFLTNKISYMEEGDIAVLGPDTIEIFDVQNQPVKRNITTINASLENLGKGNFRHYMMKEIFDQPVILADTINAYYDSSSSTIKFPNLSIDFNKCSKLTFIACGTSYYAAMVAKYWLEKLIDLPIEVDIASEFRYRNGHLPENGLCIFLSQSGETADTLGALRYAKQKKQTTLSIVNVKESSLEREADYSLQCFAGTEISVASTKGFTSQLTVLLLLSLHIANKKGIDISKNISCIKEIPGRIADCLNNAEQIKAIAKDLTLAKNVLFIGRNYAYPIALEGALKLKELSYIHAEAIAAGELKHGPIALVDENLPIILLAPENNLFDKILSNAQEVSARGGALITISSKIGNKSLEGFSKHQIHISSANEMITPIIYAIPMQLLAYYVAVGKGTDVDQPRNLAKSVTVE